MHIPAGAAKAGDALTATVEHQIITLTGAVPAGTTLRLSDRLIDLDRPVEVIVNGQPAYAGKVARTAGAMHSSLLERADIFSTATAELTIG